MISDLFHRARRSLEFLPRTLRIKIILVLALILFSLFMWDANGELMQENQKKYKYIRSEESIRARFDEMVTAKERFAKFTIPIAGDVDTEKIKSDYITLLLDMVGKNNLKTDSYRSEVEEQDGFVMFKYNITIIGDFFDILKFFNRLPGLPKGRYFYIRSYDIKLHQETRVRMGLRVEVPGVRN